MSADSTPGDGPTGEGPGDGPKSGGPKGGRPRPEVSKQVSDRARRAVASASTGEAADEATEAAAGRTTEEPAEAAGATADRPTSEPSSTGATPLAGTGVATALTDESDAPAEPSASKRAAEDEGQRLTRLVLIIVLLVLLVGSVLLLMLSSDGGSSNVLDSLGGNTGATIGERSEQATTTGPAAETTTSAAPETTAAPDTQPPDTAGDAPAPAPAPPVTSASGADTTPANIQIAFAEDSEGKLPVNVGGQASITVRNTGGEGTWAATAGGGLLINGAKSQQGTIGANSVETLVVTVEPGFRPTTPVDSSIAVSTSSGGSRTIAVSIRP